MKHNILAFSLLIISCNGLHSLTVYRIRNPLKKLISCSGQHVDDSGNRRKHHSSPYTVDSSSDEPSEADSSSEPNQLHVKNKKMIEALLGSLSQSLAKRFKLDNFYGVQIGKLRELFIINLDEVSENLSKKIKSDGKIKSVMKRIEEPFSLLLYTDCCSAFAEFLPFLVSENIKISIENSSVPYLSKQGVEKNLTPWIYLVECCSLQRIELLIKNYEKIDIDDGLGIRDGLQIAARRYHEAYKKNQEPAKLNEWEKILKILATACRYFDQLTFYKLAYYGHATILCDLFDAKHITIEDLVRNLCYDPQNILLGLIEKYRLILYPYRKSSQDLTEQLKPLTKLLEIVVLNLSNAAGMTLASELYFRDTLKKYKKKWGHSKEMHRLMKILAKNPGIKESMDLCLKDWMRKELPKRKKSMEVPQYLQAATKEKRI